MAERGTSPDSLVGFARHWFRYGGGPPETIVARFGLTPRDYFASLLAALDDERVVADDDPRVVRQMRSVARRRIWVAG